MRNRPFTAEQLKDGRLHACMGEPCRRKVGVRIDQFSLVTTDCQGLCKRAPVATLRIGNRVQMFGELTTSDDWEAVLAFARNARAANSLLVPSENTERFWCDPIHQHDYLETPSAALHGVSFLIGHFEGEGRFAAGGAYHKELIGTYEAGGRFIALRMEARYPVPEGGHDVHRALVIVGAESRTGRIIARSYTDGGAEREYVLEHRRGAWTFDDVSPNHLAWKQIKKTLVPHAEGYDERLDVDGGEGLANFSVVRMRRRHVGCSRATP